jgi:hypothetical protein
MVKTKKQISVLGFGEREFLGVLVMLFLIFSAMGVNLRISLRKARDAQRKSDLRALYEVLEVFSEEYGYYPFSTEDGRIVACGEKVNELGERIFEACEWYGEGFLGMSLLLGDPRQGEGRSYVYISNGRHYQILAALESEDELEFSEEINGRSLLCGQYICNFGKSDGKTPLKISLDEYEEILERERNEKLKKK